MSSPQHGLDDLSDLPFELLQTLTNLIERGEPLDASQAFEGLTPVTQAEILARLQAQHEPAPPEDLRVPVETEQQPGLAAIQSAEAPAPALAPLPDANLASAGTHTRRATEPWPQSARPAAPAFQAQQAAGEQQQKSGKAQARGPAYTEGSDANSPYNPPPRTRQRLSAPEQPSSAQPPRQLPQVRLVLVP